MLKKECFLLVVVCLSVTGITAQRTTLHFKDSPHIIGATPLRTPDPLTVYQGKRYVILQFAGIPNASQRRVFEEQGVRFLHYIPDQAYYVSMPADLDVNSIATSIQIGSLLSLQPQHKISATLQESIYEQANTGKRIRALFVKDISAEYQEEILRQFGIQSAEIPLPGFPMVEIDVRDENIAALSEHPTIIWLDIPPAPEEALRYVAVKNERVEALYTPDINLSGAGITVGIGDAGKVGDHIDLNSHVTNYSPYIIHTHPTHVSGIIAGRPNFNPQRGQGIAPEANIVTAFYTQIITDAERFMTDHQMLITNNSYGSSQGSCTLSGDYNTNSIFIDQQLTMQDSLLHVFSAGNDGYLTCDPYPQRYHTILNGWQCAKNTLVVGMLNHQDGINTSSSRGPVDDGRLKPEIMAVGTDVWSTRPNNIHLSGSGTSFSGPAIAGISALLYEAYQQEHGVSPDAALIKALLLNTVDDLGQAGPDFSYGYGRVNAKRAYDALMTETWFESDADQGEAINFMLNVPANIAQLRVMLLWKDPAAAPYAAPALVNDLALQITDPSATIYNPWVLNPTPTGCTSAATRGIDNKNPQEQVTITNPTAGMYTLTVFGNAVPFGPQDFYLVYELVPSELLLVYPNGKEPLVPGAFEYIRWDATGNAVQPYSVAYSLDNGANWMTINSSVSSSLRNLQWEVPSTVTDQLRIRITAGAFQDLSDTTSLILQIPQYSSYTLTSPCRGYAQLSWTASTGADLYAIFRLIDGWMQQIDTTSATSYLIGGLDPAVKEWFCIAPVLGSGKQGRRVSARSVFASGGSQCPWMNDMRVDALISTTDGRKFTSSTLSAAETIAISLRNMGNNSVSDVPVSYRINNGTIHTDTIAGPLPEGSTTTYEFEATADLSAAGTYVMEIWVSLAGDTHMQNDTLICTIRHIANDSIILPWTEGFETADNLTITSDQFALPGIEFCDFDFTGGIGRIRTHAGGEFMAEGSRALTMDAFSYAVTSTNFADLTINLAAYDTAMDDIRLTFSYMHHIFFPEQDSMNRVWVRGSDTDPWIELLDFRDLPVFRGVQTNIETGLPITDALKEHGQNFSSSCQVRFSQQGDASADNTEMEDGYTIDNLHLFAVTNDLRIIAIDHPQHLNCGLGMESITVAVENTAQTTLSNIAVAFQVNGSPVVTEQIPSIPAGDTLFYAFNQPFNFSEDTSYAVNVWVHHALDSYAQNDSLLMVTMHNANSVTAFPYLEDFEQGDGGWYAEGINSSLEFGTPAGSVIAKAASGKNAWVTNLEGDHNDDEVSYIISPCFDLTTLTNPVLSFSHIYDTETDYDFHWVEYSTDGLTWTKLGSVGNGFNWYNNAMPQSWEGTNGTWHVASIPLPPEEPRLQLRFVFASDVGVTEEGFGLDDVHIHEGIPIYTGPDLPDTSCAVNGANWIWLDKDGQRIMGIHPLGQDLGMTDFSIYTDNPDTTADGQAWILNWNWVVQPANEPLSPVKVRLFFTEAEFEAMQLEADQIGTNCRDCIDIEDAYQMEGWKYSGMNEDNTLMNNSSGASTYFPDDSVRIVPYDQGYYAEFSVASLSELWLTGPRIRFIDSLWFTISTSNDDAEEYALTGSVNPVSPVLDIAETPDSQVVAVRFRDLKIPANSFIEEAYLQFTAAADDGAETHMTIRAEDPFSSSSYTTGNFNVTLRSCTDNRQNWNMPSWDADESTTAQHSPDLRMLVQELVDHTNWLPGKAIAFTLTGNGLRRAWSIDGDPDLAPKLYITYDSVCHRDGILYVDSEASGFATGDSWANACTDLQHALDLATRCPDAREIWVKEGTYRTEPFESFTIPSGINLYGGFQGTETMLSQRDPGLYTTVLSGDLGIQGNNTDNSNHVVQILAGVDTTIIDGFTIEAGNAQTGSLVGGGIYSEGNCMLRNAIITICQAVNGGSAIAHTGTGNVMLISDSIIQGNIGLSVLNEGGAVIKVDEGSVIIED